MRSGAPECRGRLAPCGLDVGDAGSTSGLTVDFHVPHVGSGRRIGREVNKSEPAGGPGPASPSPGPPGAQRLEDLRAGQS